MSRTGFIAKWSIDAHVRIPVKIARKVKEEQHIKALHAIAQKFVKDARISGSYHDDTGNLRSSIGYAIFKNGKEIDSYFEEAQNGDEGRNGQNNGKLIAKEKSYGNGIVLIVTAGMDYAGYVEAKGYDVLTIFAPSQSEVELKLRNLLKYV